MSSLSARQQFSGSATQRVSNSALGTLLILVTILLLAAAGRVLHIGNQSLWGDEAYTYFLTQADDWLYTLSRDVHPPVYFGAVTLWTRVMGSSEFAFRVLSVFPGLLTIAVTYQLARELSRHRQPTALTAWVPVLAALLLALSDLEIMVAQEARTYTLHLLWIVTGTLAYLRWLRTERRSWAALWVICTTLTVHTHYLGAFTGIAQGLHALVFLRGRQRLQAVGLLILAAALFMPWFLAVTLPYQVGKFDADAVQAFPSTLATLWGFRQTWFTAQWPLMMGLFLLGLIALVPRAGGYRVVWRPFSVTGLLLLWVIVPVALTYIANYRLPTLYDYRMSQITPAVVLLIAFGLGNLDRRALALLVPVIVLYGVTTVDVYRQKPPWREYGAQIAAYVAPGDGVVVDVGGGDYTVQYYLDPLLPETVPARYLWTWRFWEPETYEAGLPLFIDTHDTLWLAQWHDSDEMQRRLSLSGHVQTSARSTPHFNGIDRLWVYSYHRLPETPLTTFENGMILHAARILADGRVDLLWGAARDLARDDTVTVKWLADDGTVAAQLDRFPFNNQRPTSAWDAGTTVFDPRPLPDALPPGTYTVTVGVYHWQPDGITDVLTPSGEPVVAVGSVTLE